MKPRRGSPWDSVSEDITQNGENLEPPVESHLKASRMDPTRWRDDPEAPSGADLVLRAACCPQSPTADDLARLAMSVDETLRRPTIGISEGAVGLTKQRSEG
jgi:hypothetical protein